MMKIGMEWRDMVKIRRNGRKKEDLEGGKRRSERYSGTRRSAVSAKREEGMNQLRREDLDGVERYCDSTEE